jgi:thiol-disulfide isomerase/thioredoxin
MTLLHRLGLSLSALVLACAAQAAPLQAGDLPPPTLGVDWSGDKVALPAYAGKAVIVTFWATWCPYCLKEMPILENVQVKAGKDQMAVIAVNTEAHDVFRRASRIMRESMHLELVNDAGGDVQKAFGVKALPWMVIIGRDGRIVAVHHGYDESRLGAIVADINQALQASPAPAP